MTITNTLQLTKKQEDNILSVADKKIHKLFNEELTHQLNIKGTRLNLDTFNYEVVLEFGNVGFFNFSFELNENKKPLLKTFKITEEV